LRRGRCSRSAGREAVAFGTDTSRWGSAPPWRDRPGPEGPDDGGRHREGDYLVMPTSSPCEKTGGDPTIRAPTRGDLLFPASKIY